MYDNVDMILSREQCPGIDLIKVIPKYLTKLNNQGTGQYGEYVLGNLGSLKTKISEGRVRIYDSSLCKYFLGDNFKTLTRGDTKRAIEKISDSLHLPFHLATISRIDFANNFIMQYPEGVYYPYLGEAQYYKRLEQNNGLYYSNQLRQLVFYGKEYEQRVKRQPIPELYKDRNVLRYEMRFKRQLRKQFNRPEIKAELLYDEVFYSDLMKRWKNEYLGIQKINSKLINMKPTGSKKEFVENLALFTISELGQPQVLKLIEEWQKRAEITKKQAYDLRACLRRMSKVPIGGKGNDLIEELDRKVKEAARY